MRITLEMVDEVINRTNVSYKIAKEALETAEGDILKAVVAIEALQNTSTPKSNKISGHEIVEWLKKLVNDGLVSQIIVLRNEKIVVDIPVVAGAVGALVFRLPTIAAIIAALATGCVIKIIKTDGETININEFSQNKFQEIKSYFSNDKKENSPCAKEEIKNEQDDDDYFVS